MMSQGYAANLLLNPMSQGYAMNLVPPPHAPPPEPVSQGYPTNLVLDQMSQQYATNLVLDPTRFSGPALVDTSKPADITNLFDLRSLKGLVDVYALFQCKGCYCAETVFQNFAAHLQTCQLIKSMYNAPTTNGNFQSPEPGRSPVPQTPVSTERDNLPTMITGATAESLPPGMKLYRLTKDDKEFLSLCPMCELLKGDGDSVASHIKNHMKEKMTMSHMNKDGTSEGGASGGGDDAQDEDDEDYGECVENVPSGLKIYRLSTANRGQLLSLCPLCELKRGDSTSIAMHAKSHIPGSDLFRCPVCSIIFTTWNLALNHSFTTHRRLLSKLDVATDEVPTPTGFKCETCSQAFNQFSEWKQHSCNPLRKRKIVRPKSSDSVSPPRKRGRKKGSGKGKKKKCGHCGHIAATIQPNENGEYVCNICEYVCKSKDAMLQHRKENHATNQKRFQCNICSKTFQCKTSLNCHHKRFHSEDTPRYQCDQCDYSCHYMIYLRDHIARKHAEKPFQCWLCPYGTMQEQALQNHMKTHTEDRPYTCPVTGCHHRARSKESLRAHMSKHEVDRKYPCFICGKSFKTRCTLKNHQLIHSTEKPFKCAYCEFRASHRSTIHRHRIKSHKKELKSAGPAMINESAHVVEKKKKAPRMAPLPTGPLPGPLPIENLLEKAAIASELPPPPRLPHHDAPMMHPPPQAHSQYDFTNRKSLDQLMRLNPMHPIHMMQPVPHPNMHHPHDEGAVNFLQTYAMS